MSENSQSARMCVLGVGNLLMRDEGFGVRAMEYLRDHYQWPDNVDFVDGGTLGHGLMPLLQGRGEIARKNLLTLF